MNKNCNNELKFINQSPYIEGLNSITQNNVIIDLVNKFLKDKLFYDLLKKYLRTIFEGSPILQ